MSQIFIYKDNSMCYGEQKVSLSARYGIFKAPDTICTSTSRVAETMCQVEQPVETAVTSGGGYKHQHIWCEGAFSIRLCHTLLQTAPV